MNVRRLRIYFEQILFYFLFSQKKNVLMKERKNIFRSVEMYLSSYRIEIEKQYPTIILSLCFETRNMRRKQTTSDLKMYQH